MTLRATALVVTVFIGAVAHLAATGRAEVPRQPRIPAEEAAPVSGGVSIPEPVPEIVPVGFVSGYGADQNDPFWSAVAEGMGTAAEEAFAGDATRRYLIQRQEPFHQNAVDLQLNLVEQALALGVQALVVAPLDAAALAPQLIAAQRRGVSVTVIGEVAVPGIPMVAPDHYLAGMLAAQRIQHLLPERTIAIVGTGGAGVSRRDLERRRDGALSVLGPSPEIPVRLALSPDDLSLVLPDLLGRSPSVAGVIALDGPAALAVTAVARELGRTGELVVLAMDPHRRVVDELRRGEIAAVVAFQPRLLGSEALQAALFPGQRGDDSGDVLYLSPIVFANEDLDDETVMGILRNYDLPADTGE